MLSTKGKNQNKQIIALSTSDIQSILDTSMDLSELANNINLQNAMETMDQAIFGLTHEIKEELTKNREYGIGVKYRLDRIETYSNLMAFVAKVLEQIDLLNRHAEYIEKKMEATSEKR